MKYCQECGKEMFDDAMVCPNCGTYQTILTKADEIVNGVNEAVSDVAETETMSFADMAAQEHVPTFETEESRTAPASFEMPNTAAYQNQNYQENTYQGNAYQGNTYNGGAYQGNAPQGAAYTYDGNNYGGGDQRFTAPTGAAYPIQKYSFWKYLLLGLITCGIYNLYYMYKWTEDTNRLSQGVYKLSMNYLLVFLLGIVTCGIYYYVWVYQQGERLKVVGDSNGIMINETGVHHLLLSLLLGGVGALVSQYIFFNNTNRISGVYNGDITRDQANQKTSHIPAIIIGIIAAIIAFAIGLGVFIYQIRNTSVNNYSDFDLEDYMNGNYSDMYDDEYVFDTIVTDDGSLLEIYDAIIIKDANGDPAIAVEFHWENNSDSKNSAMWTFDIAAEQNGVPLTMSWPAAGDPDIDMKNYSQSIFPG
ncbi:MAG: DUF4234 domain-containing protein, partial [Firmicutes bacterium]|nr:DUF4234 domain-containing protein [Bacillota bacterium]